MNDTQEQTICGRPILVNLPRPTGFQQLLLLFTHPVLAMMVIQVHRRWFPAFFGILLLFSIASCHATRQKYRHISEESQEVLTAVADDIAPFGIRHNTIVWNPQLKTPYHTVAGLWQIDLLPQKVSANWMEPAKAERGISKGLIITPKNVVYWWKNRPLASELFQVELLPTQHLEKIAATNKGVSSIFNSKELLTFAQTICIALLPLLFGFHFFNFLWCVIFCLLIYALSSLFTRKEARHSFKDFLVIGINYSFPPTLISLVWYAFCPASWDYESVYFIAFVLYLFYAMRHLRHWANNQER